MQNNKQKLSDVIDINFLQKFQDAFSNATGMASISVDLEGPVTNPSNFTDFCINKTRGSKEGLRRCNECDLKGGETATRTGRPAVYFCHAGLMDFGAPIIVEGQQLGSVLGGQVLPSPPNEDKFRRIAKEIGIDPDEYIKSLKDIKIVPESQIRSAAELLYLTLNEVIKGQAHLNRLSKSYQLVATHVDEINTRIHNYSRSFKDMNESQAQLIKQIQGVVDVLKKINDVAKTVSKIAENTQMISINASIEAARSGVEGRSFAVIAQEIRSLANESRSAVSLIEGFTTEITNLIVNSLNIAKINSEQMNTQSDQIHLVLPMLENILKEIKDLNKY